MFQNCRLVPTFPSHTTFSAHSHSLPTWYLVVTSNSQTTRHIHREVMLLTQYHQAQRADVKGWMGSIIRQWVLKKRTIFLRWSDLKWYFLGGEERIFMMNCTWWIKLSRRHRPWQPSLKSASVVKRGGQLETFAIAKSIAFLIKSYFYNNKGCIIYNS